jgi:hypothetical protein
MSMDPLRPPSTFGKARRRQAYRRLGDLVRGIHAERHMLTVDEVSGRLGIFQQTYVGVRPITVNRIVGTVDRTRDFGPDFLPRRGDMAERWRGVERAYPQADFPPIVVYEVEGNYFVVDGHHRVAIAKQRGMAQIDAEVTRLRTRFKMPGTLDIGAIIASQQEQLFLEESGLARVRPEAMVACSRPQGYVQLLELVKVHGYNLSLDRSELIELEQAAASWYDHVYLPAVEIIRRDRLDRDFPEASDADLFLYAYHRRLALFPERGDIPIPEAIRIEDRTKGGRPLRLKPKRKASEDT